MKKFGTTDKIEKFPIECYLDKKKEIKITIVRDSDNNYVYEITTENETLIKNLQMLTNGTYEEYNSVKGIIEGAEEDANIFVLSLDIFEDIVLDFNEDTIFYPTIPSTYKMLMSQKEGIKLPKLVGFNEEKNITTDLHSHYTAMLEPEKLLALALKHNVDYNIFFIYALNLEISDEQREEISTKISKRTNEKKANEIMLLLEENRGNYQKIKNIFKKEDLYSLTVPLFEIIVGGSVENQSGNIQKILQSCSMPENMQNTFTDMLDVYVNRFPFTNGTGKEFDEEKYTTIIENESIPSYIKELFIKMCNDRNNPDYFDNDLQDDQILWIARNAKEENIQYIEMSNNKLSSKNSNGLIKTFDKTIEKVERETGTTIRFLAGVSRSKNPEEFGNIAKHIKESLKSKYVVGFDVLGEELNKTEEFEELLAYMTRYALNQDPDMVIRVHAGEANTFEGNILKTLEIVYGEYLKKLESVTNPQEVPKPNLRIGHGIYGINLEKNPIHSNSKLREIIFKLQQMGMYTQKSLDDITLLDFMAEMETIIIERCITSNTKLSHQNSLNKEPIKTYIDSGIKCVLGTDGYGVYRDNFSRRTDDFNNSWN